MVAPEVGAAAPVPAFVVPGVIAVVLDLVVAIPGVVGPVLDFVAAVPGVTAPVLALAPVPGVVTPDAPTAAGDFGLPSPAD